MKSSSIVIEQIPAIVDNLKSKYARYLIDKNIFAENGFDCARVERIPQKITICLKAYDNLYNKFLPQLKISSCIVNKVYKETACETESILQILGEKYISNSCHEQISLQLKNKKRKDLLNVLHNVSTLIRENDSIYEQNFIEIAHWADQKNRELGFLYLAHKNLISSVYSYNNVLPKMCQELLDLTDAIKQCADEIFKHDPDRRFFYNRD